MLERLEAIRHLAIIRQTKSVFIIDRRLKNLDIRRWYLGAIILSVIEIRLGLFVSVPVKICQMQIMFICIFCNVTINGFFYYSLSTMNARERATKPIQ